MDLSRVDFSLFKKSEGAPKAPSEVPSQVGKSARVVVKPNESNSSGLAKNNLKDRKKSSSPRYPASGLNSFAVDLGGLSLQLLELRESISKSAMDEVSLNATRSALLVTRNLESLIDARGLTRLEKQHVKARLIEVSRSLDVVRNNLRSRNDLFFEKQDNTESSAGVLIEQSGKDVDLLKQAIFEKITSIKTVLKPRPSSATPELKAESALGDKQGELESSLEKTKFVAALIVSEGPKVMSSQLMPNTEKLVGILVQIEAGHHSSGVDTVAGLEPISVPTHAEESFLDVPATEENPFALNG